MHEEITSWRRELHAHPELLYEVHRTAAFVTEKLKSFGCDEVVTGLGKTGVVGVIHGRRTPASGGGRAIGLRADMDALPIHEETGKAYQSTTPGMMHACGHDGHTSMLLGAARYLAETRDFSGDAVVIFQPAEEGGAGGKAMVDDGLMERFRIEEVFGMHNMPGMAAGCFGIRPGPLLAAADQFTIEIEGKGGHAAKPHEAVDPVLVGAQIVNQVQSIVSRNVDPLHAGVVSICIFQAGTATNVIPGTVHLGGTARSLAPEVRDLLEKRLGEIVGGTARLYGARAVLHFERGYPVTRNHEAQTKFAAGVAAEVAGGRNVDADVPPVMGGEDFSFMLEARPGAFMFIGNGDSAGLHHPAFDFNDDIIPLGVSYWVSLAEAALR